MADAANPLANLIPALALRYPTGLPRVLEAETEIEAEIAAVNEAQAEAEAEAEAASTVV